MKLLEMYNIPGGTCLYDLAFKVDWIGALFLPPNKGWQWRPELNIEGGTVILKISIYKYDHKEERELSKTMRCSASHPEISAAEISSLLDQYAHLMVSATNFETIADFREIRMGSSSRKLKTPF